MNRILEALKQIEARKPPPREAPSDETPPRETPPVAAPSVKAPPVEKPSVKAPPVERPSVETPPVETPSVQTPAEEAPASEKSPEEPQTEAAQAQEKPRLEDDVRDRREGPVKGHDPGYRELAANILAGLPPGRPAVLLFTSPGQGEGKTTTLAPLAALLAEQISGGILAVDCNLGRPQLADQFGVAARLGLRAVLSGAVPWQEAVRSTSLEGLRVLPALPPGPGEGRPVDLSALVPLLEELRRHYRLVLLDAASLANPELAPLVGSCDGTCLVVRLGQTTRRQAKAAVRAIHDSGGRLLGCIVTGAVPGQ